MHTEIQTDTVASDIAQHALAALKASTLNKDDIVDEANRVRFEDERCLFPGGFGDY